MRVGEGGRWESGEGVWRPGSVQCHRRAHLGHPGPLDCACVCVCVCVCVCMCACVHACMCVCVGEVISS